MVSKPLQIDWTAMATFLSAQEMAMMNSSFSLLRQPVNILKCNNNYTFISDMQKNLSSQQETLD